MCSMESDLVRLSLETDHYDGSNSCIRPRRNLKAGSTSRMFLTVLASLLGTCLFFWVNYNDLNQRPHHR